MGRGRGETAWRRFLGAGASQDRRRPSLSLPCFAERRYGRACRDEEMLDGAAAGLSRPRRLFGMKQAGQRMVCAIRFAPVMVFKPTCAPAWGVSYARK